MNLYLLTQDEAFGYDTYDSCIVAAEDEKEAVLISPDEYRRFQKIGAWASKPENVSAVLIGVASPEVKKGVVLSSFNAG